MLKKFWMEKIIKSFELNLYSIKFQHIVFYISAYIHIETIVDLRGSLDLTKINDKITFFAYTYNQ